MNVIDYGGEGGMIKLSGGEGGNGQTFGRSRTKWSRFLQERVEFVKQQRLVKCPEQGLVRRLLKQGMFKLSAEAETGQSFFQSRD